MVDSCRGLRLRFRARWCAKTKIYTGSGCRVA
uniref:Uncharacterized protein n=1 Tax=Arundo donax TaxID=35708 RepID=A0A0A9C599_ARUDO